MPNTRFLVEFFFLALWIYWPIAFWPLKFLMRNLPITLLRMPYSWWVACLLLSNAHVFGHLITICLGVSSSCSLRFLDVYIHVFHEIWDIFSIISSNILSAPTFFSFWNFHDAYVGLLDGVPQVPKFTSIFFLFFRSFNFHCPIFKYTESFFYLYKSAFESF